MKGVPTKKSTNERRYRVRDGADLTEAGTMPMRRVVDRGMASIPRCLEHVIRRTEYYAVRKDDFLLSINFCVEQHEPAHQIANVSFEISRSYRAFHDGLWDSVRAPECEHTCLLTSDESIELNPDVAAGTGMCWGLEGDDNDPFEPERVCIALVKGDSNSRWLVVAMAGEHRKLMIRGNSTCVSCAVNAAIALPGRWLVVI